MKRNKVILYAAGATVVVIILYLLMPGSASNIPTYIVRSGDFHMLVVESGTVRAKDSYTVTAPRLLTGGPLQVVMLAPEGSISDTNQVLVRFDPSTAMKRIQDKQTDLKTALADLAKLKAQQSGDKSQARTEFETAKLNFQLAEIAQERMQYEPEAKKREAKLEFERAKLTFEQAKLNIENKGIVRKSELNNLQLRISQIRSDIAVSQKEMEQLTVRAPMSGLIVYENNWSTGRKIAKGDQPWPGMPLISLPDLSSMQSMVNINEMDIAKIEKDQKVEIVPDAFPDKLFAGKITRVSQIGRLKTSGSNIKVFDIVIDFEETDDVLKPGITTTNRIIVGTVKDVLSIPIISVFEEEGSTFVFVEDGASFEKREVELGDRNDDFVVVNGGLEEGEAVALRNPEKDDALEEEVPAKSMNGVPPA